MSMNGFRRGKARGKGKSSDSSAGLAAVCCLLALAALVLARYSTPQSSALGASAAPSGGDGSQATAWSGVISQALGITMEWKATDLIEDYDLGQAVVIKLQGDRVSVTGPGGGGAGSAGAAGGAGNSGVSGVQVTGSTVKITTAGTYVFSGELRNGQILVEAKGDDKVHLVLGGVTVHNDHTAPLYVINADKTIITLVEGTVNTFTDAADYKLVSDDDDPKGPVYSKDDLTINGRGTLVVEGNYMHGIVSKDSLKIVDATIVVTAVHHAVKGNDMVAIRNANLTIRAGKDGIHSHTTGVGFIYIESGAIDIVSGTDGMQAETTLVIVDGDINIVAGGGSTVSPKKVQEFGPGGPGAPGGGRRPGVMTPTTPATPTTPTTPGATTTAATTTGSYKGLKSRSEIIIHDGRITVDSRDDSIHADNSIIINGGTITVSTGDDGVHADKSIVIGGGNLTVLECYEGIESSLITINGGDIRIRARDDGINGANRKMGGAAGGAPQGPGGFGGGTAASVHKLFINGGYIFVDADGDGIDVNGSITMTGGFVVVNGPLTEREGALDYDVSFAISGGTIIASGSTGMAQAPSSAQNQGVISVVVRGLEPGTLVSVVDEKGVSVLTYSSTKRYESLVLSAPAVVAGKTYQVYTGGSYEGGTVKDGVYSGGTYSGGMLLGTVTATAGGTRR